MKIAILTINDNHNYGNRLQNFALTNLLKNYGDIYTLYMAQKIDSKKKYYIHNLIRSVKKILKKVMPAVVCGHNSLKTCRMLNMNHFTDCYIPTKGLVTAYRQTNCDCDYLVLGSDQIWNYQWLLPNDLSLRLGSFSSNSTTVVSYAASFGVSEISDDVKPIFQKYLPRLHSIAVREDNGAKLIKDMTGLNATVVLDPTLMLDSKQWNTITREFVPNDDRYGLTYFLGKPSDQQENTIKSYAMAHGCRVRRILDLRDKETYVAGPQDFVELFSKAQYVFTDSYHACCFSILYHKQFTVFNRAGMDGKASMNSRMETLFRLFDLNSVVMDDGLAPQIDYEKVDQLLAQHRAESKAWLDKALEA